MPLLLELLSVFYPLTNKPKYNDAKFWSEHYERNGFHNDTDYSENERDSPRIDGIHDQFLSLLLLSSSILLTIPHVC